MVSEKKPNKIILAIETSCDETAAAVLSFPPPSLQPKGKGRLLELPKIETLSSVVKSQIKLHSKMGGVVPEVAARAHVKNIRPVVELALSTSGYKLESIDYIAVTSGPGLIPSLIVGVEFAKTLAFALNKPVIPVNHMLGHLYSPFADLTPITYNLKPIFPMVSLIVSGGHTMLVLVKGIGDYKVIGETVDDAAGEAFDKVAKLLKLPYPGGPVVSKLAQSGKPDFHFPRPMINSKDYNFSFSGLKTAVLYHLQSYKLKTINHKLKTDICKAFQDAAIDVLVTKTLRAVKEFGAKSVSISGGVSANTELQKQFTIACKKEGLEFFAPQKHLSTDNAEMIGLAGVFMLYNNYKPVSYQKVRAESNLKL